MHERKPISTILAVAMGAALAMASCADNDTYMNDGVESNPALGSGEASTPSNGGSNNSNQGPGNNSDPSNNGDPNNSDPTNNSDPVNNSDPSNNDDPNNSDPFNHDDPNNQSPNNGAEPGERPDFEAGLCSSTIAACAGNPDGVWTVDAVCTDMSASLALGAFEDPSCQDASIDSLELSSSGQVEINAGDEHFAKEVTISVDGTITVPQGCRDSLDGCGPIEDQLADRYAGASVSCSDSGGCDCTLSGSFDEHVNGDFDVVSGEIEVDLGGGDQQRYRYCVDDGWLHLEQRTSGAHMPLEALFEG